MRFQAITQLILVGLALVMVFMIIRPMFTGIQANQEELREYRNAVNTAGQFNAHLTELRNRARSFNQGDMEALNEYIPSEIDQLSVSRDIVAIVEENGMTVRGLTADEPILPSVTEGEFSMGMVADPVVPEGEMLPEGDPLSLAVVPEQVSLGTEADRSLVRQRFNVDVLGSYDQMKDMLADFEQNAYSLRLTEFTFDLDAESDTFLYSIVLETYALANK